MASSVIVGGVSVSIAAGVRAPISLRAYPHGNGELEGGPIHKKCLEFHCVFVASVS